MLTAVVFFSSSEFMITYLTYDCYHVDIQCMYVHICIHAFIINPVMNATHIFHMYIFRDLNVKVEIMY